jgi:hypothetical protein
MADNPLRLNRHYFEKRVGLRWEVWYSRADGSADPANGATEWQASSIRYWRWISAARTSLALLRAHSDGKYQAFKYRETTNG